MKSIFKPSSLFIALMLAGQSVAVAQTIVPPPAMPGAAPSVVSPDRVTGIRPVQAPRAAGSAVAAPAPSSAQAAVPPATIDTLLPSAAKPDATPTPSAIPGQLHIPAAPPSNLGRAPTQSAKPAHTQSRPDAFAGLVLTPVSDSQLNRFVFPEPIEGIYFSEGAPLPECPENAGAHDPCKPVFLNGKRMMLLQFRAGAKGPVQMLAHLSSGRVVTLNLAPAPGPGAVVRVDGAEDGASDARLIAGQRGAAGVAGSKAGLSASEAHVEVLSRIARGDIPAGFEVDTIGQALRFEFFDLIPMAVWSNGERLKAYMFQVRAHSNQPVAINAALFRTANIKAVALDTDTITYDKPATLYVLESLPEIE